MNRHMKKRSQRLIIMAGVVFVLAAVSVAFQQPMRLTQAAQTERREDDPRAVLQKVCGTCHALDRVTSSRRSRAQWEETTDKMVAAGAKGTEEEFTAALNYLVGHYGRVNVNTATASEIAEVVGLSAQEAEAIVTYRKGNGKYEDFESLSKTPGVAMEKLEKSRDAISF